jgi:hypothetical protein
LFLCSCRKLASDNQATVFATDAILTTIMCMRSSRYSWDLLVSKQNGKVGTSRLCVRQGSSCSAYRCPPRSGSSSFSRLSIFSSTGGMWVHIGAI